MLPTIVQTLESAQAIDGAYDQAGPHRVLGRIQCMAPPWPLSEGDLNKSLEHLLLAVKIAPENSTNHLYLAETLLQLGRTEEAYRELELVLKATRHAIFPKDLEEDQEQAMRLMKDS